VTVFIDKRVRKKSSLKKEPPEVSGGPFSILDGACFRQKAAGKISIGRCD
jgi:hypothetical protein